jgi:hypothetical protein
LAFYTPAAFAQTSADRSLNADQSTEPADKAAAEADALKNAVPASPSVSTALNSTAPDLSKPDDAKGITDVSSMTREQLEAKVKFLTENLAAANTETEFFRQQWLDLRLRDEALGVEALTGDQAKLEDKLVQSVKELYQSEMKRREALNIIGKLLDSANKLIQTAPNYDPKVRADYEIATRAARDYIAGHFGASIPLGSSISDAKIVDVNTELNGVILNVGKTQGVKDGMTFVLYQDSVQVGTVKVVMSRDLVCEADVETLQPKVVLKVGDRAEVSTGQ